MSDESTDSIGQDVVFEEPGQWQPGYNFNDPFSFRAIVMSHFMRIAKLSAADMHSDSEKTRDIPLSVNGGYMMGQQTAFFPDTREMYCNAVECLADILAPYFDEDMRKADLVASEAVRKIEPKSTDLLNKQGKGNFEVFRYDRHKHCRALFRALSTFMYRKRYFEASVIED